MLTLMPWLLGVLPLFLALGLGQVRLATTTSVYDSGLLDALLLPFTQATGTRVEVLAVGSGQALRLAERGDVEAVLSHAPELEREGLKRGYIAQPLCLAQNAFLLVGPKEDPARVREAKGILEAFRRLAQAPFVSRGDRSGTHLKERELWAKAGVKPHPPWYLEAGAGMGQTLVLAAEKRAYTLTDPATFLRQKERLDLLPLYARDEALLLNQYTFFLAPRGRNLEAAQRLWGFLKTQAPRLIQGFRLGGQAPFKPLGGRCIIPLDGP